MSSTARVVKCVVVGDNGVGKTSLLLAYATKSFPHDPMPTVFDGYAVQTEVQGTRVSLDLRDTCGSDDYDRLRPLAYPQTDVFVLCFSLADPERIARAEHKWCAEVRRAVPGARVLLVGTKLDLRADLAERCVVSGGVAVSEEAGAQLARRIGAVEYVECSALTQHGVERVFEEAVRASFLPAVARPQIKKRCVVF